MRNFIFGLLALCAIFSSAYAATEVDAKKFIQSIEGDYTIQKVGGDAPHAENSLASIFADADEAVLTMPYCPPGGKACDPGYHFFPYKALVVKSDKLSDGTLIHELEWDDAGTMKKYKWTEKSGVFTFLNPQYDLDGNTIALEHVLERKP